MPFEGNTTDGRHYWLTPPGLMESLQVEFDFDCDPCPYPKPENYDGLTAEWGRSSYVNPPFKGPTAWVRKAIEEHKKGKRVVFVFPIDKWVHLLLEAGAKVRNLRDVKWCATEGGLPGKGSGRHIAAFILDAPISDRSENMSWRQRIGNYHKMTGFPESLFIAGDGRVVGMWIMGNDYRARTIDDTPFYGAYPAGYLRRVKTLFPDRSRVLHLFSGKVDTSVMPGSTVDINADLNPTFVDDAQTLENVPLDMYNLVMCDPPYSEDDAERYGTTLVKRNKVLQALGRCSPGTFIVWLDQVLPMYSKSVFSVEAVIGMVKSTNHRFRVVTIFRKL